MKQKLLYATIWLFVQLVQQHVFAAAPTISSFTPAYGAVGTIITITGTNLSSPTSFTIGGVSAIIINNTGTTLTGMVMPGASTGVINVTTSGGSASGSGIFRVIPGGRPQTQQGSKLVGTGASGTARQGTSVALSADGNTAIVGGYVDNGYAGAAWVYTRSGGTWTQQGSKLVGTGASGTAYQGTSVALSADGNTAIVGGAYDNISAGAVWVFVSGFPVAGLFTPSSSTTGNTITVLGKNFTGAIDVRIGNIQAGSYAVVSDSIITAVVPANSSGDIVVTNSFGKGAATGFTYCSSESLSATSSCGDTIAGVAGTFEFVNNCSLIGHLVPNGASPVRGSVNTELSIEGTVPNLGGHAYVQRHYDITANDGDASTATLTLYFTQGEFDAYNAAAGSDPLLPASATDVAGIAHLRVQQFHGSSTTKMPGSYTGWTGSGPSALVITPNSVLWNSSKNWWEVSIPVTGFGGFFVTGFTIPLAVNTAPSQNGLVSVSPVPANSSIVIKNSNPALNNTTAVITDLQGRAVLNILINQASTVDISQWPAGLYYLRLANGEVARIVRN